MLPHIIPLMVWFHDYPSSMGRFSNEQELPCLLRATRHATDCIDSGFYEQPQLENKLRPVEIQRGLLNEADHYEIIFHFSHVWNFWNKKGSNIAGVIFSVYSIWLCQYCPPRPTHTHIHLIWRMGVDPLYFLSHMPNKLSENTQKINEM